MNDKTIIIEFGFGIIIIKNYGDLGVCYTQKKTKQKKSICLDPETFGLSG